MTALIDDDALWARAVANGHPAGDKAALDAQYDMRAAVPNWQDYADKRKIASERVAADYDCRFDIAYGDTTPERLDIILPRHIGAHLPVQILIHGGYWRGGSRQDFRMLAGPLAAAGCIAVVIDYALCPNVSFSTLVAQCDKAVRWMVAHIAEYGGDNGNLHVTGHSAGAHLAAMMAVQHPGLFHSVTALSGVYDLAPIGKCFLQDDVRLHVTEIAAFSPIYLAPPQVPALLLAVGGDETAAFHWHYQQYGKVNSACPGLRQELVAGANHNSILDVICDGNAMLNHRWLELIAA